MILSIKPWQKDVSIKLVKRVTSIDGKPCTFIDSKIADNKARKQSQHAGIEHMKRLSRPEKWRLGNVKAYETHLSLNRYTPIWKFNF